MIYTERKITVRGGVSSIDYPVILFRGDREVDIIFEIIDVQFKFKKNSGNMIDNTQASYAQLAIQNPDGSDLFTDISACENGKVTLRITKEMIDEVEEVGLYNFHIRLFNEDKTSRITIPAVMRGIEIREPIAIEDEGEENDPEVPAIERMWIGYLPYDPEGKVGIDSLDVIGAGLTKKYIDGAVQGGTLKEVSVGTMSRTSIGVVPESAYACCVYPANKNFVVTIDNGIGGKESFNEKHGDYAVNGELLNEKVDNVQYRVSGFLSSMQGERFFYVD